MFGLSVSMLVCAVAAVLASGASAAFLLRRYNRQGKRISLWEYGICSVLLVVVVVPVTGAAGGSIARANAVGGYQEYWNGSIKSADFRELACARDGICLHTYDCDPYLEQETYWETETYTDAKGNVQTRQVSRTRWVTKYHSCPYATHEYDYWLDDSLGRRHTSAANVFAAHAREWRPGSGLPDSVARGAPPSWTTAKRNLDAGDPDPVTGLYEYTNYLLAAQDSALSAYSGSIDHYRQRGMLPHHTKDLTSGPVRDGYLADKAVFVGVDPTINGSSYTEWQQALGRLNSWLGSELEGDLHVLAVDSARVDNPDDYTTALLAYWQSRDMGKHGLAKNAIMLVIGVDDERRDTGRTVAWARAKTGIPEGNGAMLSTLSTRLPGKTFHPRSLLGWPTAHPHAGQLEFTASGGVVEQIIMTEHPFQRPCMDCDDPDDHGTGYVYLAASAYISGRAQLTIGAAIFVAGLLIFALAGYCDFTRFWPALRNRISSLRTAARNR